LIENIIDFDPKQELERRKLNYNDIIKSSSSEKDSNCTSQQSIKIDSDYSDDLRSMSSLEKLQIQIPEHSDNKANNYSKNLKNDLQLNKQNSHSEDLNKTPPESIYKYIIIFNFNLIDKQS